MTFLIRISLCFLAFSTARALGEDSVDQYAITNVNVVPMMSETVIAEQTVLIANGTIEAVGPQDEISVPEDYQVIDGLGQFIMPGLSDMHVHFRHTDEDALMRYLKAGVTQVREMNGRPFMLEWRDRIEKGELIGPRMIVAAPTMGNFSSPREGWPTPETPEEAIARVQQFKDEGYDLIKVHNFISKDVFLAMLAAQQDHGMPVAGHVPVGVSVREALGAGFSSIEHMTGFFDAIVTDEGAALDQEDFSGVFFGAPISKKKLKKIANETADAGAYVTPSLMWFTKVLPFSRAKKSWSDPQRRKLGLGNRMLTVKALHDAGVRLMLGSDSDDGDDLPATAVAEELALLTDAGLSPFEALQTATVHPASYLGLTGSGVIAPGANADLIILTCNPLANIRCVQYIDTVFARGKPVQ